MTCIWDTAIKYCYNARAAVVHLNFRAGSTFPVPVCTVPSSMDRTSLCNKVDAVRLYASYRLNLLLPKGQICVFKAYKETVVYRTLLSLHEGSFEITLIVPLKGVFVKMKRLKKLILATNSDFLNPLYLCNQMTLTLDILNI